MAFIIARRSPAAGDDLKRNMAQITLLFVMRDDLKRDMGEILLLFVSADDFKHNRCKFAPTKRHSYDNDRSNKGAAFGEKVCRQAH